MLLPVGAVLDIDRFLSLVTHRQRTEPLSVSSNGNETVPACLMARRSVEICTVRFRSSTTVSGHSVFWKVSRSTRSPRASTRSWRISNVLRGREMRWLPHGGLQSVRGAP